MTKNPHVVTDLSLKAARDANEAILRTVRLAASAEDAALIHIFAHAMIQAEHEAVMEAMGDKEPFKSAKKTAEEIFTKTKDKKRQQLKVVLPLAEKIIRGL